MSKKTPDRCSGMGFLKPHDEHNAYYILTPQRMEKIMEFADAVEGQISLVFYDEKLFAAVRRESMFDAVMDEPVSKQTEYIHSESKGNFDCVIKNRNRRMNIHTVS